MKTLQLSLTTCLAIIALLGSSMSFAQDNATAPAATPAPPASGQGSDKLNLKPLEDKYWAAKDTDFNVVQNRTYSKDHRVFVTGSYGVLMNDPDSYGRMTALAAGYYLSERWGFELNYETGNLKQNSTVSYLAQFNGLRPNYNKFQSDLSLNGIWVPFYAKMSFMNRSIVYFDMQFAAGIGMLSYQNQIDPLEGPSTNQHTTALNFDFTQQLFFSDHWAVRLDVKNKFSSEDLKVFRLSGSQFTNRDLGKVNQQDTTILLGITYFFGANQSGGG